MHYLSNVIYTDHIHTVLEGQPTDRNTLVFKLRARCERRRNVPKDTEDPAELYINHEVLSSQLEWSPQGEQAIVMAHNPPASANRNIVLAKLRPGQEIDMELHAVKGVGKEHAKFSPVGVFALMFYSHVCWGL